MAKNLRLRISKQWINNRIEANVMRDVRVIKVSVMAVGASVEG